MVLGIGKKCFFCQKKEAESGRYLSDTGKRIVVCINCVPYAERRAFRKL